MVQAGFVMRMEGGHLPAALQDSLPDYVLAFEEAGGAHGPAFFYTCRRTDHLNEEYGDLLAIIQDFEVLCSVPDIYRYHQHDSKAAALPSMPCSTSSCPT